MNHTRNRTATGRRSVAPAGKAAAYFAYGRDPGKAGGRQRGEWVGPQGEAHSHQAVLAWARQLARRHENTSQALLSVPEGRLSAADYAQALNQSEQIGDYRLVVHNDTAYSHAHVLFFRDKQLDKEAFLRWHEAVRQELAALEKKQLAEQAQRQAAAEWALKQEQPVEQVVTAGWEHGRQEEIEIG
jgi:hypothetical protein